jgi:hypothetical protein
VGFPVYVAQWESFVLAKVVKPVLQAIDNVIYPYYNILYIFELWGLVAARDCSFSMWWGFDYHALPHDVIIPLDIYNLGSSTKVLKKVQLLAIQRTDHNLNHGTRKAHIALHAAINGHRPVSIDNSASIYWSWKRKGALDS